MKYLYQNCITEEYYTVDHELTRDECYRGEPKYIDDPHPCLCDSFCGVIDSGEDLLNVLGRHGCYFVDEIKQWLSEDFPHLIIHVPSLPLPKRKFKYKKRAHGVYCKFFKDWCIDSNCELPADTRCDDCPISFRYELFKANSEILNIEHVYESSSQKGELN